MARVPYAEAEEVPEQYRDLLESSLQGRRLHVYQALGNNPEVLGGLRDFFGALWSDTGLSDRERELVILTAASENRNGYEWHQHVRIARGEGLDDDVIAGIAEGDTSELDDRAATLVRYARAVVRGEVDDDVHAAVAAHYDDGTIVGIAALVEAYDALGGVIDALGVDLEEGEEFFGWDPRET